MTVRGPYTWGDAELSSERPNLWDLRQPRVLGTTLPRAGGFRGSSLFVLSQPDRPITVLEQSPGLRMWDRSGREAAVRAHTSAVGVRPRGGPGPCAPGQRL